MRTCTSKRTCHKIFNGKYSIVVCEFRGYRGFHVVASVAVGSCSKFLWDPVLHGTHTGTHHCSNHGRVGLMMRRFFALFTAQNIRHYFSILRVQIQVEHRTDEDIGALLKLAVVSGWTSWANRCRCTCKSRNSNSRQNSAGRTMLSPHGQHQCERSRSELDLSFPQHSCTNVSGRHSLE